MSFMSQNIILTNSKVESRVKAKIDENQSRDDVLDEIGKFLTLDRVLQFRTPSLTRKHS